MSAWLLSVNITDMPSSSEDISSIHWGLNVIMPEDLFYNQLADIYLLFHCFSEQKQIKSLKGPCPFSDLLLYLETWTYCVTFLKTDNKN